MIIKRKILGDVYLAASIPFIFLSFLYFGVIRRQDYGISFLVIGLVIAIVGMVTKGIVKRHEAENAKLATAKKPKKKKK